MTIRIEKHLGLVGAVGKRLLRSAGHGLSNRDDVIAAGYLGLVEAARTFSGGKGVRFSTWATIIIEAAMLSELRRGDTLRRGVRSVWKKMRGRAAELGVDVKDVNWNVEAAKIGVSGERARAVLAEVVEAAESGAGAEMEAKASTRGKRLDLLDVEWDALHYSVKFGDARAARKMGIGVADVRRLKGSAISKIRGGGASG